MDCFRTGIIDGNTRTHTAPKAELWPHWQKHDAASTQTIDHSLWDTFLKKNLVAPHPSGINRVRYASVAPEDRKALKDYSKNLQGLPISSYNRAEQRPTGSISTTGSRWT